MNIRAALTGLSGLLKKKIKKGHIVRKGYVKVDIDGVKGGK